VKRLALLGLALAATAAASVASLPSASNANVPVSKTRAADSPADPPPGYFAVQDLPYYPYAGKWTFARIWTNGGFRGYGRFGRGGGRIGNGGPGWSHDYPSAEINFSKILAELTYVHTLLEDYGGNILHFEDPRLSQFPMAYVSEAGEWDVTQEEAEALRKYLLKGGFVMFDDMRGDHMYTLAANMKVVLPDLDWILLDGTEPVFQSFFEINLDAILRNADPLNYGVGQFYGLFEDNDKTKRMIGFANPNVDLGEHWEYSDTGWFPIDLSNEAYKVGVNLVIYAMTH
jgi:hypothetical protein